LRTSAPIHKKKKELTTIHITDLIFLVYIKKSLLAFPLLKPKGILNGITTLFTFGDSYSTQYLNLATLTYPNPNNTSATNGYNWVHYFTTSNNMTDWDLAYNSAPIDNSIVKQDPNVIDVTKQITELFLDYFLKKNQVYDSDKTLYAIWVDVDTLITYYHNVINRLSEHNAKKIILINVPPLEKSPKYLNNKSMENLLYEFNNKRKLMVQMNFLNSKKIELIDAYSIFDKIITNPNDYGFENVNEYCNDWKNPEGNNCLPIDKYFWLNDLHPTTKVHSIFANELTSILSNRL
ncbi:hypothetical protein BJ944DRAFT_276367, partial [Cunninghamella echinulata]